jgi:hypothetical protein
VLGKYPHCLRGPWVDSGIKNILYPPIAGKLSLLGTSMALRPPVGVTGRRLWRIVAILALLYGFPSRPCSDAYWAMALRPQVVNAQPPVTANCHFSSLNNCMRAVNPSGLLLGVLRCRRFLAIVASRDKPNARLSCLLANCLYFLLSSHGPPPCNRFLKRR